MITAISLNVFTSVDTRCEREEGEKKNIKAKDVICGLCDTFRFGYSVERATFIFAHFSSQFSFS